MKNFSELNIVGLTGMSGAGKTLAAEVFLKHNYIVINCDKLARDVVSKNSPCLNEIAANFGSAVINADGTLNRREVAAAIFSSDQKRLLLNSIMYPYIIYKVISEIAKESENGNTNFLIDAPTLFESGADGLCGSVVSIVADREICEKRIIARDNISAQQAKARLDSQNGEDFFRKHTDFCVCNNSTHDFMESAVTDIAAKLADNKEAQ